MNPYHQPDPDEISELRIAQFREIQYRAILNRHPDCRDPMHPGCSRCEDCDGEPVDPDACFA